jgi:hypothetical protein
MFGCDSNFTETKDLTLAIIAERDGITFTLVLLKGCEHPSLPYHMICASTIKHPTRTTGGVSLQNKLGLQDTWSLTHKSLTSCDVRQHVK